MGCAGLVTRIRDLRSSYYKHQPEDVLDMLRAGLANAKAQLNWDPVDMTVSPMSR